MARHSFSPSGKLREYMLSVGVPETEVLRALREETSRLPNRNWPINPETATLLQFLIRMSGAHKVLELGTFTGYSALAMALALPDGDGRVVTCDVAGEWTEMGTHYWREAGVERLTDLRIGHATDVLASLAADGQLASFDLAFIDADKANFPRYFDAVAGLLRPGGILVADNVLWGGRVADDDIQDEETIGIRRFNEILARDSRFRITMLPIGDGITLARKNETTG